MESSPIILRARVAFIQCVQFHIFSNVNALQYFLARAKWTTLEENFNSGKNIDTNVRVVEVNTLQPNVIPSLNHDSFLHCSIIHQVQAGSACIMALYITLAIYYYFFGNLDTLMIVNVYRVYDSNVRLHWWHVQTYIHECLDHCSLHACVFEMPGRSYLI
jgi:hypothetical protein